MACPWRSRGNHFAWRRPSCPLKRNSFLAIAVEAQRLMKKNKRKEIQEKTAIELVAESRNLRQEIFNLRLQQASAQLEKPGRLRTLRRDIARIETRLSALRNQQTQPTV